MTLVTTWSFENRLEATFQQTLPKLAPEIRAQFRALIEPRALAIIAAVLVAWVISHAVGLGELIDLVILATGAVSIGLVVFTGLGAYRIGNHLYTIT